MKDTMSTESTEPKPCAWLLAIYTGIPVQATTDEPTAIRWRKAGGYTRDLFDRAELDAAVARAVADAQRFRAALELIAAPKRPDGTWNRDREACRLLAERALRGEV